MYFYAQTVLVGRHQLDIVATTRWIPKTSFALYRLLGIKINLSYERIRISSIDERYKSIIKHLNLSRSTLSLAVQNLPVPNIPSK